MKKSMNRLARLRASLEEQAKGALRAAERRLDASHAALEQCQTALERAAGEGPQDGATLKLLEGMTTRARDAIDLAERDREARAGDARARQRERRQIDKLLEREQARDEKKGRRAEQRTTDDWVQARWGRKP